VVEVEAHVAVGRFLEGGAARLAEHLEGEQRVLEAADRTFAVRVVAVQAVERGADLGGSGNSST
jgi:hypothetical protein